MTTQMLNVDFEKEVQSFMKAKTNVTPLGIAYALADLINSNKETALQSVEVAALLHSLNKAVHGHAYKLDGQKEQARLEKIFL
jgi:hypothetical protein